MGDQIAGRMNDPRGSMGTAARFHFVPKGAKRGASGKDGRRGRGEWTVDKAEFTPFMMQNSPRHTLINLASKGSRDAGDTPQDEAYTSIRRVVFSRGAARTGCAWRHDRRGTPRPQKSAGNCAPSHSTRCRAGAPRVGGGPPWPRGQEQGRLFR